MELTAALPSHRDFVKVHGPGNDFIVVDGRQSPFHLTPREILFEGRSRPERGDRYEATPPDYCRS